MSNKKVANVIILDRDNRFLIIKRTKTAPTHPLHWDLPGGHVENDETAEEAAIREAFEETKLQIGELQGVNVPNSFRKYFITRKYTGNIEFNPNPMSGYVEHDKYKWVTLEEYEKMKDLSISPEEIDIAMKNLSKKELYEQKYQEKVDMLLMEGRKEDAFRKYASLGEDILKILADEDEYYNYKHLNWMAKQLIKIPDWNAYSDYGKEQEAELVINGLNKFIEYGPRLKRKDINQYKNTEEIYAAIDNEIIKPQIARSIKKRREDPRGKQFLDAGEGTVVYEDDRYFVVRPDTMESSCYFGQKTRWCIAQPSNSYFNEYTQNEQKTFYFIKDEGMRDDDKYRKMAIQIGNESGVPIFEMFWDRFDDPYESYADNWEDAAEFLTEQAEIPLQISEKIMKAVWEHAEQNPPEPNELIELDKNINHEAAYNTNYLFVSSILETWPYHHVNVFYRVKVAVPIRNAAAINLLRDEKFVDWEGDEHNYIDDILLPRLKEIIDKEKEFTDYKTGESFDVEDDLLGENFFKKLFEYSWLPINYSQVEQVFDIDFFNNLLYIEFSFDADSVYKDASELEEAVIDVRDAFSNDLDLNVIENVIYTLMPEAVTSYSTINKIEDMLRNATKESKHVSIRRDSANEYYDNLTLSTDFSLSIPEDLKQSAMYGIKIDDLLESIFDEMWKASRNISKKQMKINFGKKYKETEVDNTLPNLNISYRFKTKPLLSPSAKKFFVIDVSSEVKFIDTEEEMLQFYYFYKFIDKKYLSIKNILQREIISYFKKQSTEEEQMQEAKKKKSSGKKDACYHKVKSRYKVWPSAYASGALVKCRKVGAKNWGNSKKEELEIAIHNEMSILEEAPDDALIKKVYDILSDEGGAAGLDAIEKTSGASTQDIAAIIDDEEDIRVHNDGDIIDMTGLEDSIKEELIKYLTEKKKKAGTESSKESSLRDWFGRKGAKGSKKGWVDCNAPDGKGGYKACGRSSGEKRKKYPACRPTPGACKERGKGKSWGKKAKKDK